MVPTPECQNLWKMILTEAELNLSKANFITWFKDAYLNSVEDSIAYVAVPNGFTKEWLENKYNKFILKILRDNCNQIKEVRYLLTPKQIEAPANEPRTPGIETLFSDQFINKETNLNPKYTLTNFIVGPSNELAQAAATSVIQNPGKNYNPLFIYGGVGLGKTHLLQAIGNEIAKNFPDKKIKYVSSEKFTNELVDCIRNKTMLNFKNRYRKLDVLIVDDVQFISGKETTQEEFFHTFNALYEKDKQIILSSDQPPKAIPTLEQRLRSRFEGGMIADIGTPDFETRLAILKTKAQENDFDIPNESLEFIAQNVKTNIRELDGVLKRVMASYNLKKITPILANVQKLIEDANQTPKNIVNYKTIIKTVADFFDLQEKDLTNKSRKQEVVHPRQIAMYLMRQELKISFPFIGSKFGDRDHTTVMYACQKMSRLFQEREDIRQEISLIREKIVNC
ncbi:MAG: chromosomal replication initiator protein DnaA [Candidatus Portnoybacteria bacterium CG_4_10_14_0_2_um_filter_39_11]|uniref:Chromosomal replication initiator protein DnaA n=1 Tax=Candidatus Portnoybacteria bacterium CG_4_10_14_0_2_um_filter_39_11 TaxID=1974797 RepID=A0A2M7UGL3_9BACT|nr:MAG: hypothetical protein AUJ33_01145 [Parcubacteria group bacterium CG1_02_40_25]PIZ70355.1 MAG: chromosomal replication initiator protein DnaA [Candidatus Portnoybacteria bacterium CG_4_10_14_0_2_um_filter_39_11]